jgi:hypothetical protein
MKNNALWIPERANLSAVEFVREDTQPLRKTHIVRSDGRRNQGVFFMDYNGEGCQGLRAELFALCRNDSWRQSATPAGYAAPCDQAQRDRALRLPVHRILKRWEVSVHATFRENLSGYLWLV